MVAEAEDGESVIFSTFPIYFWRTIVAEAKAGESVIFSTFPIYLWHTMLADAEVLKV